MSERVPGQTQDVGFQIGVSRTVPYPPEVVCRFLVGPEGVQLWLGAEAELSAQRGAAYRTDDGTEGVVRSFREVDQREHWQGVIARISEALERADLRAEPPDPG